MEFEGNKTINIYSVNVYTSIHRSMGAYISAVAYTSAKEGMPVCFRVKKKPSGNLMDVLSESNHTEDSWIALLDIDDFKKINDTYGHNAGDYVLKNLARILTGEMEKCTVARWGGEEFLVHCNDKTVDEKVVENLRKEVCKVPFVFEGQEIAVSITAGVSKFDNNRTIDKWIQDADNKLYCGKKNGKNVVVFR